MANIHFIICNYAFITKINKNKPYLCPRFMKKYLFNKRSVLLFKHFNRKGYSLFASLGKEVLIGVLAVPTLAYAKADGVSVKPVADGDSVSLNVRSIDEVVVTGSRAPLTASQSARIVEVISRDDIHRAEAQTINDVLKLATGVDVRQRGAFGVQTDISINGGTFDQIAILLNGMPLTSPQTGHNAADFPVSLNDIDHIEVLEGASARVFGSSAFSGAINIVTKQSELLSRQMAQGVGADQKQQWGGQAMVEGGSFGSIGADARAFLSVPLRNDRPSVSSSLSAGYARSDGGTDNSDFSKWRGYYQGTFVSRFVDLDWQAGITSQDYGANTFYSARFPNQYEWTRRYMGSLTAQVRPFASVESQTLRSFTVTPSVYAHRDVDHYQLTKGLTGSAAGENYHRMDVYGASVNAQLDWMLGKTSLGADVRKEHILSTAYGDLMPEADWKPIHGTDRQYSREGNRTNTSIFLEHNIIVGGLTVSAGVLSNRNTGLDGDYRFYPGIDVSYRPSAHWKLYASWNKSLRVPTFTDLYTSNSAQQGDLHLKPERNSAYKLGARFRADGIMVLVSGFYSRGTNMIDWVYETEASTKYHALNIGKLDNMGFNVAADIDFSQWLAHADRHQEGFLKLHLGYAYIHQNHKTTEQIYRSLYALEYLRHKFVATLSHHVVSRLSASWSLRWQQRMNGYHPYAKLDGKLMWTARRWELHLKADNITAHRYYDLGSVLQPGLWIMAGGTIRF